MTARNIVELKPRITVIGVGGGGGNAVNNMIAEGLQGADFVAADTDAQALALSKASRIIQLGANVTEGLGAGSLPEVGRARRLRKPSMKSWTTWPERICVS
ncbi:cell division GTPase FtsZ [Rhizobium sp. BK538]|nr:cell division GTPase FtsZ [Rhizobium sp. BK538]